MWNYLGFKESPYSTKPLKPCKEDVDLLVGREKEAVDFLTYIESNTDGIFIISGSPGVGKTSFLNIQQYLMECSQVRFGRKLLSSRELCPVQSSDSPRDLALRILYSFHKSIVTYCDLKGFKPPNQVVKIGKWLNSKSSASFEVGIQILGTGGNFGRAVALPSIQDVTFEGIRDAIDCLSSIVLTDLSYEGSFIVLDNLENLSDETLSELLMAFRDTLFSISRVWWILIGQSGLATLLQTLDSRVSDRITGPGLELKPIPIQDLHLAVEKRVKKFHSAGKGTAPLSSKIHEHLYKSSHGEIRFVFKYSHSICTQFIQGLRHDVLKADPHFNQEDLDSAIGRYLIRNQIKDDTAERYLKEIIKAELDGLSLRQKDKQLLKNIYTKKSVRPREFKDYGFKSAQEFYSNYLSKLYGQNLLIREQKGKMVNYSLRGLAFLAAEFDFL